MELKNIFLVLFVFLILFAILPVSAEDTPTPTTQKTPEPIIIQKVTMTIYGDVSYLNGVPVPAGSVIIAKDQVGSIIGKYTIRKPGKMGSEVGYNDNFAIDVWRNQSDRLNRTRPVFIGFSIGGVPAKSTLDFKQNDNTRFDIIIQSLPSDPIMTETTPNSQPTTIPLSTDTPVLQSPTQTSQPVITQIPQPPLVLPEDNTQYLYYGIIATIVIIMGILIAGIIYSYMMNKTSRDEVLQPNGEWKK